MQIEVCDICEEQEDEYYTCRICKTKDLHCEGCMQEHLSDEHMSEIFDEHSNDYLKEYTEKQ